MPQTTSLAANDGKATPILHTFVPNGAKDGVTRFKESDGTPIGDNTVTVSLRQVGSKYKIRIVVGMPVVVDETINGVVVPKVARTAYADLTLTFDDTSSVQERDDVAAILANLIGGNEATMNSVIQNLEYLY